MHRTVFILLLILLPACARQPEHAVRQLDNDPAHARAGYWLDQPKVASVRSDSFDPLWEAAQRVIRESHFKLDRYDERLGTINTQPLVSAQLFEFWRPDTATAEAKWQSGLGTIRRQVRMALRETESGFVMEPKVLVERQMLRERRIASPVQWRDAFTHPPPKPDDPEAALEGSVTYWYVIGRDHALERELTVRVSRLLDEHCRQSPFAQNE